MSKLLDRAKIETMRYFILATPDIIKNLLKEYSITEEFMIEFSNMITAELFTTSFHLSKEMIDLYPNYYSDEIMNEYLTGVEKKKEFEEELNMNDGTDEELPEEVKSDRMTKFNSSLKTELTNNWHKLSIAMFISKRAELEESLADMGIDFNQILYQLLQECDSVEIEASSFDLIGLNDEIDKLVLELIKDPEARNAIILRKMLENGADAMTPTSLRYCSKEMKDSLLHDDAIPVHEFLNIISSTIQYIGWCREKFEEIASGAIKLQKTNSSYAKEILTVANGLPEDIAIQLFSLYPFCPGSFNPIVLEKMLKLKDFTEDQLISVLDYIKQMGGYFTIKKYANNNHLNKLLGLLK